MALCDIRMVVNSRTSIYLYFSNIRSDVNQITLLNAGSSDKGIWNYDYGGMSSYNCSISSYRISNYSENNYLSGNISNNNVVPMVLFISTNSRLYSLTLSIGTAILKGTEYVSQGDNFISNSPYTFTISDDGFPNTGLSALVTSGNIKAAVYNGKSYPPGATIPLDPSVENISLVNQNYTLTMNDTQNIKNVQIDDTVYSDFPTTINVEKNTVLQMSGKDDPVITVDYTNTKKPTVKNT